MFSHEPHQDALMEIALINRAQILTDLEASIGAAVLELREMAGGRADLLASAGGSQIGTYLASPRATDPHQLLAGTFLILAGADSDLVEDAVESARRWTSTAAHLAPTGAA